MLVPLGDYINRGEDSPGVLDLLIALGQRCQLVPLLGNNEEMLLSGLRLSTQEGCICAPEEAYPAHHLAFLRSCRDYHETERHFFVHANYLPNLSLDQQPGRYLRWEFLDEATLVPHWSGKTAVVGHTTQTSGEVLDLGFLVCIDTHCHGGGWLTALDVVSGQLWQANARGEMRTAAGNSQSLS